MIRPLLVTLVLALAGCLSAPEPDQPLPENLVQQTILEGTATLPMSPQSDDDQPGFNDIFNNCLNFEGEGRFYPTDVWARVEWPAYPLGAEEMEFVFLGDVGRAYESSGFQGSPLEFHVPDFDPGEGRGLLHIILNRDLEHVSAPFEAVVDYRVTYNANVTVEVRESICDISS